MISLLPAATDTVVALGLSDLLVGISHECVLPPGHPALPRVTHSELPECAADSSEIDAQVRAAVALGKPLYTLDAALIRRLRPDVLLTQRLCDVCAVEHGSVAELARSFPNPPLVISLEPTTLNEILQDIQRLSAALEAPERGTRLNNALRHRIDDVRRRVRLASARPTCVILEWIDPLFCSGHWNPELVEIAGGTERIGHPGEVSRSITWQDVLEAAPEVLPIVCCGYSVERAVLDLPILQRLPGWDSLPAARSGRIYIADGTEHFTVPGPKIVDSLELLAAMLHPELFEGDGAAWKLNFLQWPARRR